MIVVLRFIGVINAAVWLGASVFFTFGVLPVFFTGEIEHMLNGPFWPGIIAQMALERFFFLQYLCASISIAHLLAEWVYLGRALHRLTLGLLIGLLSVAFLGGFWLTPKLKKFYLTKSGSMAVQVGKFEEYSPARFSREEIARAQRSFSIWHGVSSSVNLLVLGGLVFYFWRTTATPDNTRFIGSTKFRS